jgi:hypothetical protein
MSNSDFNPYSFTAGSASLITTGAIARAENAQLEDENARLQAALTSATLQLAGVGRDLVRYFRARGLT